MKISLNLSATPSPRDRYALTWAVPVTVLGLAGLIFLSLTALESYREYRDVRESVILLQGRETKLRRRQAELRRELERPQAQVMLRGVNFVNRLIDERRLSVAKLAERMTPLLPPQVRLGALSLAEDGSEPLMRFTIVGNSEEGVEKFLVNLEDSPHFREVAIINQGFEQEGEAAGPVTIACSARYVGAAAE